MNGMGHLSMSDDFEWSDDYCVGVEEIDAQHRDLVDLLHRLSVAIREHRGSAVARQCLDELVDYTATHFAEEEKLMVESGYPDYPAHRQIHIALVDHVKDLQRKLDSGQAAITFELLHFLRVWLMRHINEVDRRFGAYYAEAEKHNEWLPQVRAAMTTRPWWKFW